MTGLLANIPRIEAQRKLLMAGAMAMGQGGELDKDVMRMAGVTDAEIGQIELQRWQNEQRAKARQDRSLR